MVGRVKNRLEAQGPEVGDDGWILGSLPLLLTIIRRLGLQSVDPIDDLDH
jgi:hypothetical protein